MSLTTRTYEKAVGFAPMTDDELFYVNGGSGTFSNIVQKVSGGFDSYEQYVESNAQGSSQEIYDSMNHALQTPSPTYTYIPGSC